MSRRWGRARCGWVGLGVVKWVQFVLAELRPQHLLQHSWSVAHDPWPFLKSAVDALRRAGSLGPSHTSVHPQ